MMFIRRKIGRKTANVGKMKGKAKVGSKTTNVGEMNEKTGPSHRRYNQQS